MRDLIVLFVHLIAVAFRIARPGGVRSVIAESVLIKHQLLILSRSRRRAPNLQVWDRVVAGFCSLLVKPTRLVRTAIALKPSTLLNFHRALVQRKYQLLFSLKRKVKPGPKGPDAEIINAVVEMKQRNRTWGCPRIAEQINLAFGTSINKDVVRRILALHYRPEPNSRGPSWLTFLGHMKDSLWSLDLFRCESVALQTYWVLVVMDQYTRRIIGFGIQAGVIDGSGALSDVQAGDSRCNDSSQIPQFGSRPAVSISPVGSEPAGLERGANQNGSLRSTIASVH
jgi:putative transposase